MRYFLIAALTCGTLFGQFPQIDTIVSSADFQPGIAVQGLGTIFGSGLADTALSATPPLPTKLGSTEVIGCPTSWITELCVPLPLWYVSPTQINFMGPDPGTTGPLPMGYIYVRRNGLPSTTADAKNTAKPVNFSVPQPRIFWMGYDCLTDKRFQDANQGCGLSWTKGSLYPAIRGAVSDQRGNLITSAFPAKLGQYYTIWLTGMGPMNGNALTYPAHLSITHVPVYGSSNDVSLDYGPLDYAGPSPQFPGMYQINFRLPAAIATASAQASAPTSLWPCAAYNWEVSLIVSQVGPGLVSLNANEVNLPIHVSPGDAPCIQQ